jgi:hypothetical protein
MALNLSLKARTAEARYWKHVLNGAAPGSTLYEVASFNLKLLLDQVNEVRDSMLLGL